MDMFEKKHQLMSDLISMLKKHASDEVDGGLQKPEGEGDMHGLQIEKVEVLPDHKMDEPTPEHDVETKELNKGGVVEKVNATDPTPKIHSGAIPSESAEGHPDAEGSAQEEAHEPLKEREMEAAEEPAHPAFMDLFGKKRKK